MSAGADREEDRQLAAEYALGLLDAAASRMFEARLAAEPALREEYAIWAEAFSDLGDEIEAVTPPRGTYEKIEAQLFPQASKARFGLWRWLGLGATLAAGVLMLAVWLGDAGGPRGPTPDRVAELAAEDGGLRLTAGYLRDDKLLQLTRHAGRPASGRSFELWLIEGDNPPVSLGVLPETERALIVIPEALAARMSGATLAVSDEPDGGSPSGAPTGAVLAAAPLVTSS